MNRLRFEISITISKLKISSGAFRCVGVIGFCFLQACSSTTFTKVHIGEAACRYELDKFEEETEAQRYLSSAFPLYEFDDVVVPPDDTLIGLYSPQGPGAELIKARYLPEAIRVFDVSRNYADTPDAGMIVLTNRRGDQRPVFTLIDFQLREDGSKRPWCQARTAGILIFPHSRKDGAFSLSAEEFKKLYADKADQNEFQGGGAMLIRFVSQTRILENCRCSGHFSVSGIGG
jgi:hypothetical protein